MSGRKTQPLSVMPMPSAIRGTTSTTSRKKHAVGDTLAVMDSKLGKSRTEFNTEEEWQV